MLNKHEADNLLSQEVKVFTFNPSNQPIRVEVINNEPWFRGKDVCRALGIGNHNDALSRLDDDEREGVGITDPLGGTQVATFVSESGLYNLIFQSRKPEAKIFRKWVTGEVLPSLRKTGEYRMRSSPPRQYIRRGELVNADILNLLWLIGESLNRGDQKEIAIELGVSVQSVNRTLNGYNRSNRILAALYRRARQNRESNMLYTNPDLMRRQLLGLPVEPNAEAVALPLVYNGKRGAPIGNQHARKNKGGADHGTV
ncbi:MAG: Bro-N domain-containing protein [Prevotellaceae bacterium]|nr:Bro-N domain-containing protein [Prevotellaceae bacterium]